MLRTIADGLRWLVLILLCWPVVIGPWLFGSWEMWWFWVGATCIYLALACGGLVRILDTVSGPQPMGPDTDADDEINERRIPHIRLGILWGTLVPFMLYAYIRSKLAPVAMDAERSFLLFLTPILIAIPIVFVFRQSQRRVLWVALWINLLLLGLYGIFNEICPPMQHIPFGGGLHVMWEQGYSQYTDEHRASGSYYCPDHFAGVMEIALSLALGFLLAREVKWPLRVTASAFGFVALCSILLSKSRGGGLAILVIFAAALVIGFSQWPPVVRWYLRGAVCAITILAALLFVTLAHGYMKRFFENSDSARYTNTTFDQKIALVKEKIRVSSRGRMYAGALRAWRSTPTTVAVGIGPGMHQNLWEHFAASADGNRELEIWPSLLNNDFHSYEVHSDWLQLGEEYGAIGLGLFVIFAAGILWLLCDACRVDQRRRKQAKWHRLGRPGEQPLVLGALLAVAALAFHSFGDFNLQMPATVWMLGAVVALALAAALRSARLTKS